MPPEQILIKNDIFKEYGGGMTEQYVLQQMKSSGVEPIMYYKEGRGSRLELAFLVQGCEGVIPIEVKAEGNVRANSLTALLGARPSLVAIRYSMLPFMRQGGLVGVPLYVAPARIK